MIIFDLDSCLRSVETSKHMIPNDVTVSLNWVEWNNHVNENSTPNDITVALYEDLNKHNDILIVTSSMFGTADWLIKHDVSLPDGIVERDKYDNRTPEEYKKDWIQNNIPIIDLWIDDNEIMCEFTRDMDILTVQVDKL